MSQALRHIRKKLDRANEHVVQLEREVDAFLDEAPYRMIVNYDAQAAAAFKRFHEQRPIDPRLSVITGDVIHQHRTLFGCVSRNGRCACVFQLEAELMLSENQVIDAVCKHLQSCGYQIVQRLTTTQRGHDIIAEKADATAELHIEAKGKTSDRNGSGRFGKAFNSAQVGDHVANAFYCAASMLEQPGPTLEVRAGIALPDTALHRTHISRILRALEKLQVVMFWVDASGHVKVEATRSL